MNARRLRLGLLAILITALAVVLLDQYQRWQAQNHFTSIQRVDARTQGLTQGIEVETVTADLDHPWGLAFLPEQAFLVTERSGQLLLIDAAGNKTSVSGLPPIRVGGQGGLLDVALHPNFESNRWVYLSYAMQGDEGLTGTAVGRGRLQGIQLTDWQTLFQMEQLTRKGHHFGSRLVFDQAGYLFITLGDRGQRARSQDLTDTAGSVIRLHDDGRIPADNPSFSQASIYSYGHRNIQGAALHPETGQLWTHEHGPQGGDEVNIIQAGANYGWPVITYGKEYGTGFDIGEGTQRPDIQAPIHQWTPSIAPSGMAFYTGDQFPQWRGDLLIGALKFQLLVRLELEGNKVIKEHRLLQQAVGRIRDVKQGPDGYIYLLSDASNGRLLRLLPHSALAESALKKP